MLKKDLIAELASKSGSSKVVITEVLDALAIVAQRALDAGIEVPLPGIGKLVVARRAARTSRNPRTGEAIQVAERRVVKLKVSSDMDKAVN